LGREQEGNTTEKLHLKRRKGNKTQKKFSQRKKEGGTSFYFSRLGERKDLSKRNWLVANDMKTGEGEKEGKEGKRELREAREEKREGGKTRERG